MVARLVPRIGLPENCFDRRPTPHWMQKQDTIATDALCNGCHAAAKRYMLSSKGGELLMTASVELPRRFRSPVYAYFLFASAYLQNGLTGFLTRQATACTVCATW